MKTAIKRKKRLYKNFIRRGRSQGDWELFKRLRNDSSKLVTDAKETYYSNLGRKLSDPAQGVKAYWAVLNRLANKYTSNAYTSLKSIVSVYKDQTYLSSFD